MLCDDPNLFIYWLLMINMLFVEQTSCQGKLTSLPKILAMIRLWGDFRSCARQGTDQVSPMFILEHQRKTSECRFCKMTQFFFFVISKVCWTVCVFRFLNLGSLKRIYTSLFTSRDFRHCRAMILKVERNMKTRENCRKELYNVWMHFSPTCCQKCECQCSNDDLLPT